MAFIRNLTRKPFMASLARSFSTKSNKLVITLACTGNVPTKKLTPYVPVTSEEVAEDCTKAFHAGASLFHIHARDKNQKPTLDINVYRKTAKLLKEKIPEAIIQLSTGFRGGDDPMNRCDIVRLCPEMGSFCTGSNNLANIIYMNSPEFVKILANVYKQTQVAPEIECFDVAHIKNALWLADKGILSYPLHFDFVMNTVGGMPGDARTLVYCAESLPPGCTWTVAGIGKMNMKLAAIAIAMGGNVRIGLEDMIQDEHGNLVTNTQLVERVVRIAKELGREIADPVEAREILHLDPSKKDRIIPYLDPNYPLHPIDV